MQHPEPTPALFTESIAAAVRQLRAYPRSAPAAGDDPRVHKLSLPEIEHLLFYRVRPRLRRVEVLRFRQGRRKPLRAR